VRILIVEDDESIAKLARLTLEREGNDVAHALTGTDGLDLFRTWKPDLVVLDIMLPGMNGREVAREIRGMSDVPIIFLTAMGSEKDRVNALDEGADDYITKPFGIDEFAARVRAVGRRPRASKQRDERILRHADLAFDPDSHHLTKGDEEIALTKREGEILRLLMQQPGSVVTRSTIAHVVWQRSAAAATNVLDVHMSALRQKLGDKPGAPTYIETVRGEGFRLKDPRT
jgi:two-component system, OmpR family, response regulator MtrA